MSLGGLYRHLWEALGEESLPELRDLDSPRGPEWIFELTDSLGLGPESSLLDLGSGPGEQALELAERYSVRPVCIDPLPVHLDVARGAARRAGVGLRAVAGTMERVPIAAASVDLVWLRDALLHATDLELTAGECHRVLRPGGSLLLHAAFATERLAAQELELLREEMAVEAESLDRRRVDRAFSEAGFEEVRSEELGSELAEHYERTERLGSRALVRLAQLERSPQELRERLGPERFSAARGLYHWIVFELLGKLSYRTSLLRAR